MSKATLGKELWVTTADKIGALSRVCAPIAEAKVNIWALCAWRDTDAKNATFMLITDDNTKAWKALEGAGFKVEEKEVVVLTLEDKPGTCWSATQKLATAGIDANYWYYTSCGGCPTARIILSTKDNKKAVQVLS